MKQLREKIEELLCNSKCTKEEISSIMREKALYPFSREPNSSISDVSW